MSPEQATGGTIDTRSDIFSFGALLYEMVTGRRAFARDSRAATLAAVVRDEPSAPGELVPGLPKPLERLILRCLRKEPERRFQHMQDVKVELQEIKEESDSAPITTATVPMRRKRVLWSASVLAVTLAGAVAVLWPARSARPRIESLAVLPLKNDSSDPAEEYFADGMTEALITELARLGGLKKVVPRGSVMRYKGTNKSFQEIARELNVDALITGAVLHAGDRVRVTAQLIDPTTEEQLWFDLYERDVRDVLALQNEVTRAIAGGIKLKVTPLEQARLAGTRRVNPRAHEAYLRGRHSLGMLTPALAETAAKHFQEAVERDSGYAPAYSGLADAYFLLGFWGSVPPREALPKAKEAALQALEIDDSLAEAHLSLAQVAAYYDWDRRSAEREHKKAIELDPGYPDGHRKYALLLSRLGRHAEARAEIERAQQLDPLSLQVNDHAAWIAFMARDDDRALQQYRETLELDPNYPIAHRELAWVYAGMGAHAQALEMAERAVQLSSDAPSLASLGCMYGLAGRRENALKILGQLMERKKGEYVAPVYVAWVYMGLNQKDQVFEWLEKAYDERNLMLVNLKTLPIYDPLRSDRRFQDMLRRMNFPP
jgi:TolB-like protein/Tfp pilus assembly protein PilF